MKMIKQTLLKAIILIIILLNSKASLINPKKEPLKIKTGVLQFYISLSSNQNLVNNRYQLPKEDKSQEKWTLGARGLKTHSS